MPVMAVCPSCGKSYQAPDSMAGKSVRCKQCQTVFRIEAPEPEFNDGDLPGSEVDFDQLEKSFGGEDAQGTAVGTRAGGPMVDADGRVSIRRKGDVDALRFRGEQAGGGNRTNLRFRYPIARQVDLGLPCVIVLLALGVPLWLSLTTGRTDEMPTSGVGTSRYAVLLIAFLVCVVPLVHLAATKAAEAMRFNLPRNPLWRSFACACATLAVGGTIFILGGGETPGIILGIIVGVGATVCASLLLFRAIPSEMGLLAAYVGGGAAIGAVAVALILFGINFAAMSIARSQSSPTLFMSPIAIGAPWIDKPTLVAGPNKPSKPTTPSTSGRPAPTTPDKPGIVPPANVPQSVPIPVEGLVANADDRKFIKSAEQLPVPPGFRAAVTTLMPSPTVGVVRDVGGGVIELWDSTRWTLPGGSIGRNFDYNQAPLFANAKGDRVVRLVTSPYLRVESIPLASGGAPMSPITLSADGARSIEGFLDASNLIVRAHVNQGVALEQYDVAKSSAQMTAPPSGGATSDAAPLGRLDAASDVSYPLNIDESGRSIAFAPDGSVVVAGKDRLRDNKACLGIYTLDKPRDPVAKCDVPWGNGTFAPLAMAADANGRVALLLDTSGEAWLTIWRLRDETVDGAALPAMQTAIAENKLGGIDTLRLNLKWQDPANTLTWLDRNTLLLFGKYFIDARTGQTIGSAGIANAVSLIRLGDGDVAFVTESAGLRSLIRVKYDLAYLASLRSK